MQHAAAAIQRRILLVEHRRLQNRHAGLIRRDLPRLLVDRAGRKTRGQHGFLLPCAALRKLLPERTDCLHEITLGEPFCLGAVRVTAFPTPHDAAGSCGYRLDGSARFGFCTDLGTVTDAVRAALCGVDCAVIEANHDPELLRTGPYPIYLKRRIASDHGHLSNESAGALAVYLAENGAQQLILGHLSRENNTPRTALETVSLALAAAGFQPGTQPELYAAPAETTLALTAGKVCVCCQ